MGAEVIAGSHIQSSGPTFRREAYELFESIGAIDYSDRKPNFTFDVCISPDQVAAATAAIRSGHLWKICGYDELRTTNPTPSPAR